MAVRGLQLSQKMVSTRPLLQEKHEKTFSFPLINLKCFAIPILFLQFSSPTHPPPWLEGCVYLPWKIIIRIQPQVYNVS